ncbi:hypothetical protein BDW62DRAFT_174485 [Aspergillus aurantiobrunneus]
MLGIPPRPFVAEPATESPPPARSTVQATGIRRWETPSGCISTAMTTDAAQSWSSDGSVERR